MADRYIRLQDLKDFLDIFNRQRNWTESHSEKDLTSAIAIESAELQELFLWLSPAEVKFKMYDDLEYRARVHEELADVIIYCLNFANEAGIDVASIVNKKVQKNSLKYPLGELSE